MAAPGGSDNGVMDAQERLFDAEVAPAPPADTPLADAPLAERLRPRTLLCSAEITS